MKYLKNQIPNLITILNLLCGSIGVILTFKGMYMEAVMMIGFAAIFDFLDGMLARLLNAYSELGKQLDSLADLISFGFLPGMMMYHLLLDLTSITSILPYFGLLIPAFSALRLAKFNIDPEQGVNFIGFPTPPNAILFASIYLIANLDIDTPIAEFFQYIYSNPYVIIALILGFSYLLISNIPMFSLKFSNLKWKQNEPKWVLLGLSLLLILTLTYFALPLIIIIYIVLSLIFRAKYQ